MADQEVMPIEIEASRVGTLRLETTQVPYVHLGDEPAVCARVRLRGVEYAYQHSYPIKGHSAVMPAAIAELEAQGRRVLVAERSGRYLLYVA